MCLLVFKRVPWFTDVLLNVCCAQVPSSYVSLQQAVLNEVERLRKEDQPPVLNEEEFAALARSDPKSDIHDAEELQLGESYMKGVMGTSFNAFIINTISSLD